MLNTKINPKNGRLTITTESGDIVRIKEHSNGISIVTVGKPLVVDKVYRNGISLSLEVD